MPEPGELVGPYRLVSPLGKGAMGEVWRARDERLDRYVALKVLPTDLAGDMERRARMLREAKAAAAIRHPNVVTLFDVVAHKGVDILVMELVEGRTLSEILRKDGAPALPTALAWIEAIADALAAAHARDILHRDIKAANVMVASDGSVKVLDFGLAKLGDSDGVVAAATTAPALRVDRALALAETIGSEPGAMDVASYRTHAGQLLGTPMYMAPEQIAGAPPDARSEVFSVGVLAYELLRGKPPYAAATIDALFDEIATAAPPPLADVPAAVEAIVFRALAKDPAARYASMAALRDAVAHERRKRYAPRARMWPFLVGAAVLVGGTLAVAAVLASRVTASIPGDAPARPGDAYVQRALEEYDVFYTDKAMSSLRAALAVAPEHPRANAYMVLFGAATPADRTQAIAAAKRARGATPAQSKDRALIDMAVALAEAGPSAATAALARTGAAADRELAFWKAELDYRAGAYTAAAAGYRALLADAGTTALRGRIYDHYSSVLLYLDDPAEALRIGALYKAAFPGEADAVGVYATTLAAAGRHAEAIAAAEEALRLSEGEDTLAGLGKVLALAGDRARAQDAYRRSLERAGPARRPLRRAALGMLQWIDGDLAAAAATVAPCLPGGADAAAKERGACLFVAGIISLPLAETAAAELDALAAAATPVDPAYGAPRSLAALLRARSQFLGGGCVVPRDRPDIAAMGPPPATLTAASYAVARDFYAAYHVPFLATWATCEAAALRAVRGEPR